MSPSAPEDGIAVRPMAGRTPAHGLAALDPRVRVVACVVFALVTVSLSRLPVLVAALLVAAAAAVAAQLPVRATLRRLAAMDGFMVVVLLLLPATVPGRQVAVIAGYPLSADGLAEAARILLTGNAVLLMLLALIGSLETAELGQALSSLGMPERLVQLLLFTVRAIDLIGREYATLRNAMRARAFRMRTSVHAWGSMGYLLGMLLLRSLDHSERILAAMRCRGFTGKFPVLAEPRALSRTDAGFGLAAALVCTGLLLAG